LKLVQLAKSNGAVSRVLTGAWVETHSTIQEVWTYEGRVPTGA